MRVLITPQVNPQLEPRLRAKNARQRAGVRAASENSLGRVLVRVLDGVPRDTNYMADHTFGEVDEDGMGYRVGYRSKDFIGKVNPVTGKVITEFYPPLVIRGTSRMAGRDFLTPALEAERANYRRAVVRALSL